MVNCSTLFEIEMLAIDRMTRAELITAVRDGAGSLPADFRNGVRLEDESTDHLRLLLVAARLLHALRVRMGRQHGPNSAGPRSGAPCNERD